MNDTIIKHLSKSDIIYSAKNKQNFCGTALIEDQEEFPPGTLPRSVYVKFENGAYTKWHWHTGTQILLIEQGVGFVEQKGCPPFNVEQGGRILIPENVWHRHGAIKGGMMVHLAITNGETVWDTEDPCE
ncbi:MAG: cupin domain-containing protein [Chitinophagaceae bacterium]